MTGSPVPLLLSWCSSLVSAGLCNIWVQTMPTRDQNWRPEWQILPQHLHIFLESWHKQGQMPPTQHRRSACWKWRVWPHWSWLILLVLLGGKPTGDSMNPVTIAYRCQRLPPCTSIRCRGPLTRWQYLTSLEWEPVRKHNDQTSCWSLHWFDNPL